MLRSLQARLRRLESQARTSVLPAGQGLAALLDEARRHNLTRDHVPRASLTEAELDAQIANFKAQVVAGARGFTPLLLEALMHEGVLL